MYVEPKNNLQTILDVGIWKKDEYSSRVVYVHVHVNLRSSRVSWAYEAGAHDKLHPRPVPPLCPV
jgi:hypothetical protein